MGKGYKKTFLQRRYTNDQLNNHKCQIKGSGIATAMVQIQSLAQELTYATGEVIKKKDVRYH